MDEDTRNPNEQLGEAIFQALLMRALGGPGHLMWPRILAARELRRAIIAGEPGAIACAERLALRLAEEVAIAK